MLASAHFRYVEEHADAFAELFPHRFDYIYAEQPEPGDRSWSSPNWQTESRHPLTDRLLAQGSYLYGVRFGAKTGYCMLDIDAESVYHPNQDALAISRILAALESIGIVRYLVCTSSYSGGIHLYFPLAAPQSSWELGTVVTSLLENAGFAVKPGQLEVFPNRKGYSVQGKPSLFNAHRLPLQMGSYLLNRDFEPIWSDRNRFVREWRAVQNQNEILPGSLRKILRQSQRRHYQVSGKAAKFINDLNAEIESGWTGHGQTNYLLGRIAMRVYIFHHVLEGGAPLTGEALITEIATTARLLPGYQEWCQHQHEIEHRAAEWARCIENSRYFHYGLNSETWKAKGSNELKLPTVEELSLGNLSWNQQQQQNTRDRIRAAIANLLNQNALPVQATARFKLLTATGIGGGSLYRHKDLWHPEFLSSNSVEDLEELEKLKELETLAVGESLSAAQADTQIDLARTALSCSTSLLPCLDGNPCCSWVLEQSIEKADDGLGGNASFQQASDDWANATSSGNAISSGFDFELAEPDLRQSLSAFVFRKDSKSAIFKPGLDKSGSNELDPNGSDLKPP